MSSSGLRKIASYADPIEAEMACELLKSHGIAAEMAGGTSVSVFGAGHPLTAQFLVVEASQVAEARTLLAGHAAARTAATPPAGLAEPEARRLDGYYETTWNEREKAAESAYRASIVGLVAPLVSWWALWLLLGVFSSNLPLNARCARRAWIATAVMAVPATFYFVLLVLLVARQL